MFICMYNEETAKVRHTRDTNEIPTSDQRDTNERPTRYHKMHAQHISIWRRVHCIRTCMPPAARMRTARMRTARTARMRTARIHAAHAQGVTTFVSNLIEAQSGAGSGEEEASRNAAKSIDSAVQQLAIAASAAALGATNGSATIVLESGNLNMTIEVDAHRSWTFMCMFNMDLT